MASNNVKLFTQERINYYEKLLKNNPNFKYGKEIEDGINGLKELL